MTPQNSPGSTRRLNGEDLEEVNLAEPSVTYRPVPNARPAPPGEWRPEWRVRFDVESSPGQVFGLAINGDILLGRGSDMPNLVDLSAYDADDLGVSRHHLMLRPTAINLFAIDMGSKNGTFRNSRTIGVNMPYALNNGDILNLGRLQLRIHVVTRPTLQPALAEPTLDLADILSQIARAITSQLDQGEVLEQVARTAMRLTQAGEIGIWLVDEETGALYLEAERGIQDEAIRRMRLPASLDNPVGQVLKTGLPLRTNRQPGEDQIKVKTGYLVEALLLMPITLGDVTFGVLAATHREPGRTFALRDERLLVAIADFAAGAILNARQFGATDLALDQRVRELSALNKLSQVISSSLDINEVHDLVIEQIREHWQVQDVVMWFVNSQTGQLQLFPQDTQKAEKWLTQSGAAAEAVLKEVTESGKPRAADFTEKVELSTAGSKKPGTLQIQGKSFACIPLMSKGQAVGALGLFRKKHGMFSADDLDRLQAFGNQVATAIENARLYATSERQRQAIQATANAFPQPLVILDEGGQVLVANGPAQMLIDTHMSELFEGISRSKGQTIEVQIGDLTYLTTAEHNPNIGTIVVMQDITYVKRLEQDRAEMIHILSHDLKTPLATIKGWSQLLKEVAPPDEKIARFTQDIVGSADRMQDMISKLLKSVQEEMVIQLTQQPCDLKAVVTRAMSDMQGTAQLKNITLDLEKSGAPAPIMADEDRLYHLVLNLLDNAIKYSPEGTQVQVGLEYGQSTIAIRVRDQGPGIPQGELPRIFDRYFRGKAGINVAGGTGLGLSVVRAVARAHGGEVEVNNLLEGGSEFTVTLPGSLRVKKKG